MPPEESSQPEETAQPEEKPAPEGADEGPQEARDSGESDPYDPDTYPLRDPGEDPRWAVWVVRIWLGFALLSLTFILTMLILGFFYD